MISVPFCVVGRNNLFMGCGRGWGEGGEFIVDKSVGPSQMRLIIPKFPLSNLNGPKLPKRFLNYSKRSLNEYKEKDKADELDIF